MATSIRDAAGTARSGEIPKSPAIPHIGFNQSLSFIDISQLVAAGRAASGIPKGIYRLRGSAATSPVFDDPIAGTDVVGPIDRPANCDFIASMGASISHQLQHAKITVIGNDVRKRSRGDRMPANWTMSCWIGNEYK